MGRLSKTHNLLTAQNWEGASLDDVLAAELSPYRDLGDGDRVRPRLSSGAA
ncbi:HWE histidine kinase domain-containing protein [Azospirillum doebereinerae]